MPAGFELSRLLQTGLGKGKPQHQRRLSCHQNLRHIHQRHQVHCRLNSSCILTTILQSTKYLNHPGLTYYYCIIHITFFSPLLGLSFTAFTIAIISSWQSFISVDAVCELKHVSQQWPTLSSRSTSSKYCKITSILHFPI